MLTCKVFISILSIYTLQYNKIFFTSQIKKEKKMIEYAWMIHGFVDNFRPLFHIGGSLITLFILVLMLHEWGNDNDDE